MPRYANPGSFAKHMTIKHGQDAETGMIGARLARGLHKLAGDIRPAHWHTLLQRSACCVWYRNSLNDCPRQ